MRIKTLLQIIFLLCAGSGPLFGQTNANCIDNATISVQGNVDQLSICQGDGLPDVFRFRTSTLAMPFGYVVTDEDNNILLVSISSVIDLEGLPPGTLRVWAFSFLGEVLAEPGMNAGTDPLGSVCSALTANFITIGSVVPDGGTVSTDEGLSSVTVCVGDGMPDVVNFTTTSTSSSYSYIITDEDGIILDLPAGNSADFDGAGMGICRVYGVAHAGAIIAQVGDNIFDTPLAEECADLSDNYIEVIRLEPDGGTVSLTNGTTEATICVGDGQADLLSFQNTSTSSNAYVYVITDDSNIILDIIDTNSADFDDAGAGISRVWGLSYTGNLTAGPGDDAAAVDLSDDCYELSGNFITVTSKEVDGGTVSLADGSTDATVCIGDDEPDVLTFSNTSVSAESYVYVITDEDNNILALVDGDSFDFSDADPGVSRVWGLSYSGTLIAAAGDNAAAVALSDECYELSENFITVTRTDVDGATVNLTGGATETTVCVGDGSPDVLTFENTSTAGASYVYVITDDNNIILDLSTSGSADFDGAPAGICRVWGLSYTGNLTAGAGDDAATVALSDECFDLSDNFVTVNRIEVDGGMVTLTTGGTEATVCVGDADDDILLFLNDSESNQDYAYIVTDEDNNILALPAANIFDFNTAPPGVCRVWGVSYSGNLLAQIGDNAAAIALSDECYELSENFITVTRKDVDGGEVALADGGTEGTICINGGSTVVAVITTSTATEEYIFVVTDEDNNILSVSTSTDVALNTAAAGVCRIWGLSYTGSLTAAVGDNAGEVALSDECFELSSNFITITKKELDGGMVSIEGGATEIDLCVNDGEPDSLTMVTTAVNQPNYIFVITDNSNNILDVSENGIIDFEGVEPGICRIWGLAYSGNLIAEPGDNAGVVDLSDECFELSANFVTVNRIATDGATVSLSDGSDFVSICTGDGLSDELSFENTSGANAIYAYVITDEDNNILNISFSSLIDFESAGAGICRVWGLSYSGDLQAGTGENATEVDLSDGCFDLSDNFVTVDRTFVDGGTVTLDNGETDAFICASDNQPILLSFLGETTAADADYTFIITDETNEILVVLDGNSVDFGGVPAGSYRVWGLSFTGMIIAETGDDAALVDLSDGCFNLSGNFVTVVVDEVEGGSISSPQGDGPFYTCPGDGNPDVISFDSTGTSGNYVYVITDEDNVILDFADGDSVDFDSAPAGTCRVWGLAYSGNIVAMPGDTAVNLTLTDGCWDLSDNFLTVVREVPDGGTVSLAGGDAELFLCLSDDDNTSATFANAGATSGPYAYVITDTANVILDLAAGDSYDFSGLPAGTYRVWGLAFTGNVLAQAGDQATEVTITDDCWDLSDNFVQIVRDEPDGGTVSTISGAVEVVTCDGDGEPDIITFVAQTTTPAASYAFVITDLNAIIIDIVDGDSYDFEGGAQDSVLVWGLAYTGNVLAQAGDDASATALTDGCWDLSDNTILVYRGVPSAGDISTSEGQNQLDLCIGDGEPDVIIFDVQGASDAPYLFLITDQDDFLLGTIVGDMFDFDNVTAGGVYHIYGLSYTGQFQAFPGDNIFDFPLASGCFDLTDSFIEVNAILVDGGLLFTPSGETAFFTCPGDGVPDVITFNNTSSSSADYIYFLTDANNAIQGLLPSPTFNFETAGVGVTRIWGASFTGNLTVDFGDILTEVEISDGCFALSENFLEISRDTPFGGDVSTEDGETEVIFCVTPAGGDLSFVTTSTALVGYQFVVTDEFNDVILLPAGNTVDFSQLPVGLYRVWGLSYTGTVTLQPGENLFSLDPVTSCYEISGNFVEVYRSADIDGGVVSTLSGEDVFYVCPNDVSDLIVLQTTSQDTNYLYIVTDTANQVLIAPLASNLVDFDGAPERTYRIWGLSYTGSLSVPFTGLDADVDALADSCYALSANFITVNVATPAGGTITTAEGAVDTTIVQGDGLEDPITFVNQGASNSRYQYLVTDEANVILALIEETTHTFDFEGLVPGTYRVWGVAYTGDFVAQSGEDAGLVDLSDDCFALSDNFVTVTHADPFTGGEPETTAVPEEAAGLEVRVAPNPATTFLNVNLTLRGERQDDASTLQVFNATGAEVLRQRIPTVSGVNHVELDLSNLPSGLYVIYVRNGKMVEQTKVLKQE